MRCTDSLTAISGRPTRTVLGKPVETSTSASTGTASMPTRANVFNLASMARLPTWRQEMRLLFSKDEINRPAPSGMRPRAAAVLEQLLVVATGVEQGIGQDRQAVEGPLFVDVFGHPAYCTALPVQNGGKQGWRKMEGVAEDVTK